MPVQGLVQIGDRFLISPYEDEIMCMMIMKKNSKSHDSLKRYLMILVLHSNIGALECRFAGKMEPPKKGLVFMGSIPQFCSAKFKSYTEFQGITNRLHKHTLKSPCSFNSLLSLSQSLPRSLFFSCSHFPSFLISVLIA